MRVLDRADPRWIALLIVPALLAAGGAQPTVVAPRAGAALPRPVPALLPYVAAGAEPVVTGPVTGAAPQAIAARREVHASRGASRARRGSLSPQERGRAALRALAYDPADLGYRVRFLPYRGNVLGTTHRLDRVITVYVQRGQSELTLRTTIAHELGHALDVVHGDRARREAYRQVRRLPAGPWFPCNRCNDFASPAGDFAEVFAVWLLAGPGDFRGRLAGPPSTAQLRELAPLFVLPGPQLPPRRAAAGPSASPAAPEREEEPEPRLPGLLERSPSPSPGSR